MAFLVPAPLLARLPLVYITFGLSVSTLMRPAYLLFFADMVGTIYLSLLIYLKYALRSHFHTSTSISSAAQQHSYSYLLDDSLSATVLY